MSQMERGERPVMQEQEDSEEGETPADPSAGEWLPGDLDLPALRRPSVGGLQRTAGPGGLFWWLRAGRRPAGAATCSGLHERQWPKWLRWECRWLIVSGSF